jgi:1-deoxy-D-xylulose-5-phosphate reductoisomerase
MENIAILGSTGSIGRNTLEVVENLGGRFRVIGLTAGYNLELLLNQYEKFKPEIISLEKEEDALELKRRIGDPSLRITFGQEGAEEVAGFEGIDTVVSAITGIKGLRPTIAAVKAGRKLALANKESMVVAGALIRDLARQNGARIIPVDSEHSGVFQCLSKERIEDVNRVILTASGGPFFKLTADELKNKTPEEALNHPRWKMGDKVTIDSATMMNKGLELIEAKWLFDLRSEQLDILIHPQSIVHSLIEMKDGSILAQLSPTDMRIPIQYALTFPDREKPAVPMLDLSEVKNLEFYQVDEEKFPLVSIAKQVIEEGNSHSVALNAANEVSVDAFLQKKIKFFEISELVSEVIAHHRKSQVENLEDIFEVDRVARHETWNLLDQRL